MQLQQSEICQSLSARFLNLEAGPIRMDRADGKGRKDCEAREGKSRLLKLYGYKYMKKIGLLAILGFVSAFGNEFDFDSMESLQPQVQPSLLRYVSVDLTAIPNLHGIVNVGLRQEGEKHGYDFGISAGKTKSFMQSYLYGSYLRFIDASETAKYYLGVGLRGGSSWWPENYVLETTGYFSAGRSYTIKSGARQFFEINLHWPHLYHSHFPLAYQSSWDKVKYKNNFSNYRNIHFAIFYGWFF